MMFARTDRLLLRPGWAEDAPALARAVGDEAIVRNLIAALLGAPSPGDLPTFLITERTAGAPRLAGICALLRRPSGSAGLLVAIARPQRGRGLATEACAALIEIARTIGLGALEASLVAADPAAARLLEKLGFTATGARPRLHRLDLANGAVKLAA